MGILQQPQRLFCFARSFQDGQFDNLFSRSKIFSYMNVCSVLDQHLDTSKNARLIAMKMAQMAKFTRVGIGVVSEQLRHCSGIPNFNAWQSGEIPSLPGSLGSQLARRRVSIVSGSATVSSSQPRTRLCRGAMRSGLTICRPQRIGL